MSKMTYFCCIYESEVVSLQHQTNKELSKMKTLRNLYGETIRIKFIYEKGHKFHGQVFYYKEGVRSGYRHSIENLNKHLKQEDQIELPK